MLFKCAICDAENQNAPLCQVCGSDRFARPPKTNYWAIAAGIVITVVGLFMLAFAYPVGTKVYDKGGKWHYSTAEELWFYTFLIFAGLALTAAGFVFDAWRKQRK